MGNISKEEYLAMMYKRVCLLHGASLYIIEGIDNLEGDFPELWSRDLKYRANFFRQELIRVTDKFTPQGVDEELSLNDIQNSLDTIFSGLEPKIVDKLWRN